MKTLRMAILSTLILGTAPSWADVPVSLSGTIADSARLDSVLPGSVLVIRSPIQIPAGSPSARFEHEEVTASGMISGFDDTYRVARCDVGAPGTLVSSTRIIEPQALRVTSVVWSRHGTADFTTETPSGQHVIISCSVVQRYLGRTTLRYNEVPLVEDLRKVFDWNPYFLGESIPTVIRLKAEGPSVSDRATSVLAPVETAGAIPVNSAAHSAL